MCEKCDALEKKIMDEHKHVLGALIRLQEQALDEILPKVPDAMLPRVLPTLLQLMYKEFASILVQLSDDPEMDKGHAIRASFLSARLCENVSTRLGLEIQSRKILGSQPDNLKDATVAGDPKELELMTLKYVTQVMAGIADAKNEGFARPAEFW